MRKVDRALVELKVEGPKIDLILIGGAAVLVRHGGKRWTRDVDAVDRSHRLWGLGLLEEYGLHLVSEAILNLHPDYEERLERIKELQHLKRLRVWALGPYDLAITKIGRGLPHDIEDVVSTKMAGQLDPDRLRTLYLEAMEYWIGPPERYRHSLEVTLKRLRGEDL